LGRQKKEWVRREKEKSSELRVDESKMEIFFKEAFYIQASQFPSNSVSDIMLTL